jgi:hypothetical protein
MKSKGKTKEEKELMDSAGLQFLWSWCELKRTDNRPLKVLKELV